MVAAAAPARCANKMRMSLTVTFFASHKGFGQLDDPLEWWGEGRGGRGCGGGVASEPLKSVWTSTKSGTP